MQHRLALHPHWPRGWLWYLLILQSSWCSVRHGGLYAYGSIHFHWSIDAWNCVMNIQHCSLLLPIPMIGCRWDHQQVTGAHLLLVALVVGGLTWQGRFSPGTPPGVLVRCTCYNSSRYLQILRPSSLCLTKDPPLDSLPLNLLISAGFGTKSHLGETTCQLRWVFSQKRPLLLNICLLGSKKFLLSPLNLLSLFLVAYPLLFFSPNFPSIK